MMVSAAIVLRIVSLVFIVIAVVLTAVGSDVHCPTQYEENTFGIDYRSSYPISSWGGKARSMRNLQGQYFVVIVLIIYAILTVILIVSACRGEERGIMPEVIILGSGIVIFIICFGLEAWYASGFGVILSECYVKSWVASCAMIFIILVLYVIDLILLHTAKKRGRPNGNQKASNMAMRNVEVIRVENTAPAGNYESQY